MSLDLWVTISFNNGEHNTFTAENTSNYNELLEWAGSGRENFTIYTLDATGKKSSLYISRRSIVYIRSGI